MDLRLAKPLLIATIVLTPCSPALAQVDALPGISEVLTRKRFGDALRVAHNVPASQSAELSKWIESNYNVLIPAFGYELARRKFEENTGEGLKWFCIADIRSRYDAMRCRDPSARQLVDILKRELAADVLRGLRANLRDIPSAVECWRAGYQTPRRAFGVRPTFR